MCIYLCISACGVHASTCVHVCGYEHACGVFPNHSLPYFFDMTHLFGPRAHQLARIAVCNVLGISLRPPMQCWIYIPLLYKVAMAVAIIILIIFVSSSYLTWMLEI